MTIELYNKENINSLKRPTDYNGAYAYDYLVPMIQDGVSKYISNVKSELSILKVDNILIPININFQEYSNSYVSSLFSHYISYTITELKELKNPYLEKFFSIFLKLVGKFLKITKIDKVVYINNWFLSTNLYPSLTQKQLSEITNFLVKNFPKHALVFRSINKHSYPELFENLIHLKYKFIGSRQVYLFNKERWDTLRGTEKNKMFHDFHLQENSDYKIFKLNSKDYSRVVDLYNQLYLDKYSYLNPQFTEAFIDLTYSKKLLSYFPINKYGNNFNGVIGYFYRNGIMTTPMLGYEMSCPREEGLYRILNAIIFKEAKNNSFSLNMSSGASTFKMYRGAIPEIEYSLIYDNHLSLMRKLGINFLKNLINKVAIPLMKKKQL